MEKPLFAEVVVNGEAIAPSVIAREAQNHPAPSGKPGLAWRKAANALAIRTLLLQEAKRRGLAADPRNVGSGKRETDEESLIRTLLEDAVRPPHPEREAVEAAWRSNPERYRSPPLWKVSHILVACDHADEEGRAAAKSRADAICARANANPDDFPAIASESSDCPSRSAGGTLGQIRPGDTLPEFEAALRELAEREITARPVATRHGWHVIKLDAHNPGRALPFEAVRDRIAEAMEKTAWAHESKRFVDDLIKRSDIAGTDFS